MSRFGAKLRGVPGLVARKIGTLVSVSRADPSTAYPQTSYSLDEGHEEFDGGTTAGFEAYALEVPVELLDLPEDLCNVEVQTYRIDREDCSFEPTAGMTLEIKDGPDTGTKLLVAHVKRSVKGASRDLVCRVTEGGSGVPSSGEDD